MIKMISYKQCYKTIAQLLCLIAVLAVGSAGAQEGIPKPEYYYTDANNVDVLGGKLSLTNTGLSIGSGNLSLNYQISSYSGDFINAIDNYGGATIYFAYKAWLGSAYEWVQYMIVRTPAGTIQFKLDENDNYVGLKNSQGSVVEQGNKFIVTYPDGTIATFRRISDLQLIDWGPRSASAAQGLINAGQSSSQRRVAQLEELIYPNGYTLTLHKHENHNGVSSVTTNTGLQLKYTDTQADTTFDLYAINNTVSYCSPSSEDACSFQDWQKMSFRWSRADAMQKVFELDPVEFFSSITDSSGLTTEYHHSPIDVNEGATHSEFPLGENFIWRITKIVEPSGRTTDYSYYNRVAGFAGTGGGFYVVEPAILGSASTDTHTTNYKLGHGVFNYAFNQFSNNYIRHTATGYSGTNLVFFTGMGILQTAKDHFTYHSYIFEDGWNNEIKTMYSPQGTFKYYYDDKKRLIKRTHVVGADENAPENIDFVAGYPATCSNPKTCNNPSYFTDGEGNVTDYDYHPQSGQIAKITKPAGRNGVRPEARYTYEQKYAWYKDSSGSFQRATQPVWLLTQESTCQTGASNGSGCQNSSDEVVTTYDYGPDSGPNNLFLRGMAVTAAGETRRTCFEYDNYGNRTSETNPKGTAALTSCP